MTIYIITALSVLAVVCLSAIVAQNARKFDYAEYVIGGDRAANIKQLALALKDVEKVGAVPNVSSLLRRIRRAYNTVCAKVKRGESLYECEKWLFENYRSFTAGIRRANYKCFATLPHRGEARVIHLAATLTTQTYCRIDEKTVTEAVTEFCRYTPLSYDEICALKGAFEIALLKKISYVSTCITRLEKVKRRAEEDREPDVRLSKKEGYLYFYKATGKRISEKFLGKNTEINVENVEFAFAGALADYAKLISGAVSSLKNLPDIFTSDFTISLSPINGYLERDKSYVMSDGESKRQYLAAIAGLSRYFNAGEYAIAKGAFDLAARFDKHFGEIIFDHRYDLRAHVKGKYVAALKRKSHAVDKWIYYSSVFVLQCVFAAVSGLFLPPLWLKISVSALTFIAVYPPCAFMIERVLSFFLPKRPVPRMNYASVPDEGRTAVVVSQYLTDAMQAEKAMKDILAMQAVNKDKNLYFVALCDLKECKSETDASDGAILEELMKYSEEENLTVMVRKRVKSGDSYRAYERKRGAIRDLNEYLLSGNNGKFRYVSKEINVKPRFVLTLDADSRVGAGEIRKAVNTMLHPLNAKFDLMTFESVYSLSSLKTPYSMKFSESSGYQTYCDYDDFYFNLCERAVYCGKGIYNLKAFHEKTSVAVPDGKVLSHDVLEGALTDTGALNLAVAEDAPDTFLSDVARSDRWARGDLLLLPFANKKYCSDGIYKYIMLKNAFSYFAPVAACVLWILALSQGYLLQFLSVFFASFSAALASLALTVTFGAEVRTSALVKSIARTLFSAALNVILLPFHAVNNLLVALKTFIDYVFNSGALLKWKPFALTQGARGYGKHAAVVAFPCLVVAAVAAAFYTNIAVAVYALAFIIVSNLLYMSGKPFKKAEIGVDDEATLKEYAERTYAYFSSLGDKDLPCDNVQIFPPNGKSKTTSPTNIGYALLARVCAAELDIISPLRASSDISVLISDCEKLKKWNGHLYNWYDVATKTPVNPYFVSSVDSGNFIAALIVVKEFCLAKGFQDIAVRCEKLIDETDFSALTDKSKNRLYIGYNVGAKRYEGHYDILASEARLTAYIACCLSGDGALWRSLSRIQVNSFGNVLASWSGTAFEYLMPQLFLPDVKGSLVTASAKRAVKTFIKSSCNGLWGISESGYYAFDGNANYQYKAHGLSVLSLRNADDRCVISPYSSAMAIPYAPEKSIENLKKLRECGAYGDMGFYEAIDFSAGKNTVSSHMTHHQGMLLCALTNALSGDVIRKYFTADEKMRGGELMLEEPESKLSTVKRKRKDFVYDRKEGGYSYAVEPSAFPKVTMLYGREYGVVVDDQGSGYSRWRDKDVNAFSHNFYKTSGAYGYFICGKEVISPTFAPFKRDGGAYKAVFSDGKAEYFNTRANCSMKVYTPLVISGEVREYTLKNESDRQKEYSFVFAERVSLIERRAYVSHPAFCDLFVSAKTDKAKNTVYLKRKPRESTGGFTLAATILAGGADCEFECNRQNLYGRNGSDFNPALNFGGNAPSEGDVITPCIGIKCDFTLAPGESKKLAVVIQCAEDENVLESRVERVLGTDFLGYALSPAGNGEQSALHKYMHDERTAVYAGKLAAKLLYEPYPKQALLARSQIDRVFGFEEKTLLLRYDGNAEFTKRAVKSALACRLLGMDLRLIVLFDERENYGKETAKEICDRAGISDLASLPFVTFIDKNSFKPQQIKDLTSTAFFVMKEFEEAKATETIAVRKRSGNGALTDCDLPQLKICGSGGFDKNGDYVVTSRPSSPYSNVVCDRLGGFVSTENGGGFCYFLNSQSNKLSGWSNDPVSDEPFERVLASDGSEVLRLNKLNKGGYVRHGKGFTEYVSKTLSAEYSVRRSLCLKGRAQVIAVRIRNLTDKTLIREISYLIEPCADSAENRADVFCEKDGNAVRVYNAKTERGFYLYADNAELITDGAEALSRGINGFNPKRSKSPFNDPYCGATVRTELRKHAETTVFFTLCDGEETLAEIKGRDLKNETLKGENALSDISRLSLESGEENLDILFENLPYQVLSSRVNGKCGFYQAGGAVGFRDQLQDCLALLWSDPERVREHILLCAERQYIEGDVMHWWHPPAFGVRTKITDDRLFLPYVVCEYVENTGDESILSEKAYYLVGRPLEDHEEARLEHGKYSEARETLLLHLQRAIDSAIVTGEHGLLLIGGGDWNDALNEIGLRGRGESVWLTQFAVAVIEKFCAYIDDDSAKRYRKVADKLRRALDKAYIDGRWARAFTDDGEWLGTDKTAACKTDLICQSWAEIIRAGTEEMRQSAMKAAKELVDVNAGAVKLFSPPFGGGRRYGYISSYPEGVRENGGQYTHAAVWYLLACCKAGDKQQANKVLKLLNPVERCCDSDKNAAYKGEPYVLAGDVYTNKDNVGRAGWTWYTGSAAWLYKVIVEEMLGVKKRGETLEFSPPMIDNAERVKLRYEYEGTLYVIGFENTGSRGIRKGGVNYTNSTVLPLKKQRGEVSVTVLF